MTYSNNKVILVTGGSKGIGRSIVKEFAFNNNVKVIIASRDESRAINTTHEINKIIGSNRCFHIKTDITSYNDVSNLFKRIRDEFGGLDVAVNNAGIEGVSFTNIVDYPNDVWDKVLATNLTGVWYCLKEEILLMKKRGGSIINVASLAGLKPSLTGGAAYTASKHGVIGLTKSAAKECLEYNIRINAICPGLVATEEVLQLITDGKIKKDPSDLALSTSSLEDVAKLVVWLTSEEARLVNGVAIPLNAAVFV